MTFRILARQMDALGADTRRRFVGRMVAYLRAEWPVTAARLGATDEALTTWVAGALAEGHGYRITTEPEAAQWILLLTHWGLGLAERQPWTQPILDDGDLAAVGKLTRLVVDGAAHDPAVLDVVVYDTYLDALEQETPMTEVSP